MDTSHWIWLATAAYGIHALEEFILDWRDWARNVFGLPVEWSHFYVVNFLVIVLGIVGANVVTATPWLGLGFAGLMIINALFFHIAPMIWTRGRYSPGVATAVLFLLPVGLLCFRAQNIRLPLAWTDVSGSLLVGALLMATPIILLKIKDLPYFKQN
ncbi:MAG: HXXEE domain-containing protein [Hyphomicrobiales bacterium]